MGGARERLSLHKLRLSSFEAPQRLRLKTLELNTDVVCLSAAEILLEIKHSKI